MKKCKVINTEMNAEAEGVIVDGHVYIPAPRRDDIEPAYEADGQCYYAPFDAVAMARKLHFDLMPFSTACEWGEYADLNNPLRNTMIYWGGETEGYGEKWGYCHTRTGRICFAPEFEHCRNFNRYGAAIVGSESLFWLASRNSEDVVGETVFGDVQESHYGFFMGSVHSGGYCGEVGVYDSEGDMLLEPLYYDVEWDGMGGFTCTTVRWRDDERRVYSIVNAYGRDVVQGLTEKPVPYEFPAEKRRIREDIYGCHDSERFRLTRIDDKYGLVRDVLVVRDPKDAYPDTYSEEILKPVYDLKEIPNAAYLAWVDAEIRYYAEVLSKTPRRLPGRVGDGWDVVPRDIVNGVRALMAERHWEQPDTPEDIGRY